MFADIERLEIFVLFRSRNRFSATSSD